MLTVQQLAQCLMKAKQLDNNDGLIEARRNSVQALIRTVKESGEIIDMKQAMLDRYNHDAVEAFNNAVNRRNALNQRAKEENQNLNVEINANNGVIDAYNGECVKRYYSDDLGDAKKIAGIE